MLSRLETKRESFNHFLFLLMLAFCMQIGPVFRCAVFSTWIPTRMKRGRKIKQCLFYERCRIGMIHNETITREEFGTSFLHRETSWMSFLKLSSLIKYSFSLNFASKYQPHAITTTNTYYEHNAIHFMGGLFTDCGSDLRKVVTP